MITGALIQLCTDPRIFHLHNTKRNRRLAFLSSMFIGCFIGAAVLARSSPSAVLVVAAGLKGALVLSLFFNRGMVDKTVSLEAGEKKVEGRKSPNKSHIATETDADLISPSLGCVTPASRVLWVSIVTPRCKTSAKSQTLLGRLRITCGVFIGIAASTRLNATIWIPEC